MRQTEKKEESVRRNMQKVSLDIIDPVANSDGVVGKRHQVTKYHQEIH